MHRKYIGQIYTDSLVHDEEALKYLVSTVGEDHVILGSDYPFPLGEHHPGKLIDSIQDWDSELKVEFAQAIGEIASATLGPSFPQDKLLAANAVKLLNLDRSKYQPRAEPEEPTEEPTEDRLDGDSLPTFPATS